MDRVMTTDERLVELQAQVAALQGSVELLVANSQRSTDFVDEMRPVARAVMHSGTQIFADWEGRGLFRVGRAGLRVVGKVVDSTTEQDMDALGESIVAIVDTVKMLTQPEVLALVQEGAEVIEEAEKAAPVGVIGLARATSDVNVQKGLGLLVASLRHVGRASRVLGSKARRLKEPKAACGVPAVATSVVDEVPVEAIGGLAFTAEGFLVDSEGWSRGLAEALAVDLGVSPLGERHWVAIETARRIHAESGESPNIRRLTSSCDVSVKELYGLFPTAPGKTVARVAGLPKPVGCL